MGCVESSTWYAVLRTSHCSWVICPGHADEPWHGLDAPNPAAHGAVGIERYFALDASTTCGKHPMSAIVTWSSASYAQAPSDSASRHEGCVTAGIARTDSTPSIAARVSIRPDGMGLSTSTNEYAISLRDLLTML